MIQTKSLKHLLCAALLAVVLLLAACTNGSGGEDSGTSTTVAETTTIAFPALWGQDGVNYRVIRPDVCADNVSEAAKEITAALKAASGGEVTFTTDFLMPGEDIPRIPLISSWERLHTPNPRKSPGQRLTAATR